VSPAPEEYARRLTAHRADANRWDRADARAAALRLTTFAGGAGLAWLAWAGRTSWAWVSLPILLFLVLARWHDRVLEHLGTARKLLVFYERGLARLADRWTGTGDDGLRFQEPDHLYAADLDIFGQGSLFQLLSLARTQAGAKTLAHWLQHPSAPETIRLRQAAIDDLTDRLDLRERLWSAGTDADRAGDPDTLVRWAESVSVLPRWLQPVAALLTTAVLASAVYWFASGRFTPLLGVLAVAGLTLYRYFEPVATVLHVAGAWSRDLDVLARALAHVDGERYRSPLLVELVARLESGGVRPGAAIRRLHRLSEMHDWQHNAIFAALAAPLLWNVHVALAMERWRATHGPRVSTWLEVVGEVEALTSLAAYRYERPDDVFPTLVQGEEARFEGIALGHPLLPSAKMVRNDVALGRGLQLLVVSGSNMSGKSTLLRTVGINAVLAQAGGPVRASALTLGRLAPGATLRIQDSLQEGRSRFFAEISRVKEIADQARTAPPTLFLLDELFHGTNSHDRLHGATGVLRALLDRGAIGLVTTHDMALVAVTDSLGARAANVHFEDHFEGNEMVFDYRMKPGPVTSSNAIALMRTVGLDVDQP